MSQLQKEYQQFKRDIINNTIPQNELEETVEKRLLFLWPFNLAVNDEMIIVLEKYYKMINLINIPQYTDSKIRNIASAVINFDLSGLNGEAYNSRDIYENLTMINRLFDSGSWYATQLESLIQTLPNDLDFQSKVKTWAFQKLETKADIYMPICEGIRSSTNPETMIDRISELSSKYFDYRDNSGKYWNIIEMWNQLRDFKKGSIKALNLEVFPPELREVLGSYRIKPAKDNRDWVTKALEWFDL